MLITINEDQIPVKFILGIEKDLEGYPDPFDILYFYVNLAYRQPDRYKGSFTRHAMVTYHFKESDHTIMDASLNKLVEEGYIEQTKDEPGKEAYKIIINPFE